MEGNIERFIEGLRPLFSRDYAKASPRSRNMIILSKGNKGGYPRGASVRGDLFLVMFNFEIMVS